MTKAHKFLSLTAWALAFAMVGLVTRLVTQNQIETRYLVVLFCGLALMVEWGIRPALGLKRDWARFALNCIAATLAIIAVKWTIEGVHPWVIRAARLVGQGL